MIRLFVFTCLFAAMHETAQAQCYALLDRNGSMLYQGFEPPYSMAYPAVVPEREASRARGENLMILPDSDCDYDERYKAALSYVRSGDYARDQATAEAHFTAMQAEVRIRDQATAMEMTAAEKQRETVAEQQRMAEEQQARIEAEQRRAYAESQWRAAEMQYRNKMENLEHEVKSLRQSPQPESRDKGTLGGMAKKPHIYQR